MNQDNPFQIADNLEEEHGLVCAIVTAIGGAYTAEQQKDNHSRTLWKEVERILQERLDETW